MFSINSSIKRILTWFTIMAGLVWAVVVVISYLGVDNGFFFAPNKTLIPTYLIGPLAVFLLAFSTIFGYMVGQNRSRKTIIILFSAFVIIMALFPAIRNAWHTLNTFEDGERATISIGLSAIIGIGIGLGARISRRPLTFTFLIVCLGLPFVFTTIRANGLTSVLALIWLFLIANAIGEFFLQGLNIFVKTPSANLDHAGILSIATGLGILVLVTLAIGSVGRTNETSILLGLLLLSTLFFSRIKTDLKRLANLPWGQPILLSEFELGGLFILATLFLIFWIGTLAPEVGADALGFRTAAPAIWLKIGAIRPLPEMLTSYGVFAGELINLLVMPLTGFIAAKVVQFGLAVLLILSTYQQVFKQDQRKLSVLLMFGFWGSTLVWWQMIWGFVDLSQMFFYFCCILALRFWLDEPESPVWLIVAGIAGATSTAIKQNGIGALVTAGIVVVAITLIKTHSIKKIAKNIFFLGISSLICLLPWLIRSYLLTKNPFFPFMNQYFKSPLYPIQLAGLVGTKLSLTDLLGLPWNIFFFPANFGSFATYNPFILTIAVLGLAGLVWISFRKDWIWLTAGILGAIFWLVTEQNLRYSLFSLYLLVIGLSIGLMQLHDKFLNQIKRSIFQAVLLVGLVWGFGMQALRPSFWMNNMVSGQAFPTRVVFGEQTSQNYLESLPTYFCAEWLNARSGRNAKVWQVPPIRDNLYFDAPSFTFPHSILPITRPMSKILGGQMANNFASYSYLLKAGYTHLVYSLSLMTSIKNTPEADRKGLFSTAFEDNYLELECADRGLRLYKIRPTPTITPYQIETMINLFKNSGLEALNKNEQPLNWVLSGDGVVIKSNGNSIVRLNNDAVLQQAAIVNPGTTYELTVDYRANSSSKSATFQINWLDTSGNLLLFWKESVDTTDKFNTYRFLQTVPDGVQKAIVYITGNDIDVDNIAFREMRDEVATP